MSPYIGDKDKPETIYDHIEYGLNLGAENTISFGADFFFDDERTWQIYYPKFNNASSYTVLIKEIEKRFSREIAEKIAFKNALNFMENKSALFISK